MRVITALMVALAGVLALVAVTLAPRPAQAQELPAFAGCDELTSWFREGALEQVGPYGLGGGFGGFGGGIIFEEGASREMAGDRAATADAAVGETTSQELGDAAGPSGTGTNVLVAGVDEPDLAKTDGELLVALAQGTLQVADVREAEPHLLGSLPLPGSPTELLLDGDRLLVLGAGVGGGPVGGPAGTRLAGPDASTASGPSSAAPAAGPEAATATATLTLVDLSDPTAPALRGSTTVDGAVLSARLIDGVARVVLSSPPDVPGLVYPDVTRTEEEATQANRDAVAAATAEDWLPGWTVRGPDGAVVEEGPLLVCGDVRHPVERSGLTTLSLLTLRLDADLVAADAIGLVADGDLVSASARRLHVATTRWSGGIDGTSAASTTAIHAFALTDPRTARYVASGTVDGHVLDRSALSEHEGSLRVATTAEPPTRSDGVVAEPGAASESAVTVLAERGEALEQVGRVGGLGLGEQIRAVRFIGDLGVVVTFRQTDPLYTLDLADPAAPRLLGELKIPGYSAYLHPIGDGRLLGLGQDATETGQVTGLQASLFDLRDLAAPTRTDTLDLGEASSEAEWDPRAFTFDPASGTALIPVDSYDGASGVRAIAAAGDALSEAGAAQGRTRRTFVLGDRALLVSEEGVTAVDLADLEPLGRVDWSR